MKPFLNLSAIRVDQPMGSFFITKMSARDLLRLTFSRPLTRVQSEEEYIYTGNQRALKNDRTREIGKYIESVECTFPNSIIIAANYDAEGNLVDDESIRWKVEIGEETCCDRLIIPTEVRLASIIDGQHRLNGFQYVSIDSRLDTELVCAVFIDLPNPYQAYIFATINYNQKKVDRSLALELFGFDLTEDESTSWSPEKLAVFISRKLNTDEGSIFYDHILVAAQDDTILSKTLLKEVDWRVSTATVVDGILGLISSNPQRDRDTIHKMPFGAGRNRKLLIRDSSPLREFYLNNNDLLIYTIVRNFFNSAKSLLFDNAAIKSYIFRTVGIQALFDVLKKLAPLAIAEKDISVDFFNKFISKVMHVDFSDKFFQASGLGRSRIKNLILYKLGFYAIKIDDKETQQIFDTLLSRSQ